MTAYYNEVNRCGAASLRKLIRDGIIAPGDVDERSIEDVRPTDLAGYVQCHFFAGGGVWSYALRCAGWADDRPVWTGSCPCQPFSSAGKGVGFADERHLWPSFFHLARVLRPVEVFGEQVSSDNGLAWLNHVRSDMEGEGYVVGVSDTCAAGFGAPHIRQRLYFVSSLDIAVSIGNRRKGRIEGREEQEAPEGGKHEGRRFLQIGNAGATSELAETNGFWSNAEWVPCRNPKVPGAIEWRPIEPGTFPLAHGATARVGRLYIYGNCIVAPQAEAFIGAYMKVQEEG